jgi:hypothetical protein
MICFPNWKIDSETETEDGPKCKRIKMILQAVPIRIIKFVWILEYGKANQTVNDRIMRLFKLDD